MLKTALMVAAADAHLTAVCIASNNREANAVTFYLGTYHPQPGWGKKVAGTFKVKPPGGDVKEYAFGNYIKSKLTKAVTVSTWDLKKDLEWASQCDNTPNTGGKDACLKTDAKLRQINLDEDIVECFGSDKKDSDGRRWLDKKADNVRGYCATFNNIKTWYKATLTKVVSGSYEVWQEKTDANMDPAGTAVDKSKINGKCPTMDPSTKKPKIGAACGNTGKEYSCNLGDGKSKGVHVFMGIDVVAFGDPCEANSIDTYLKNVKNYDPNSVDNCKNKAPSGFVCGAKCKSGYAAGSLKCSNKKWTGGFNCYDKKPCGLPDSKVLANLSGLINSGAGSGGGCDFYTGNGTVCGVKCSTGNFAKSTDLIKCTDGKWALVDSKVTCTTSSKDVAPPAPTDISLVSSSIDKGTIAFKWKQNAGTGSRIKKFSFTAVGNINGAEDKGLECAELEYDSPPTDGHFCKHKDGKLNPIGIYTITITATNDKGSTKSQPLQLYVSNVCTKPTAVAGHKLNTKCAKDKTLYTEADCSVACAADYFGKGVTKCAKPGGAHASSGCKKRTVCTDANGCTKCSATEDKCTAVKSDGNHFLDTKTGKGGKYSNCDKTKGCTKCSATEDKCTAVENDTKPDGNFIDKDGKNGQYTNCTGGNGCTKCNAKEDKCTESKPGYVIDKDGKGQKVICLKNQKVESNTCVDCPSGDTADEGADASLDDTSCTTPARFTVDAVAAANLGGVPYWAMAAAALLMIIVCCCIICCCCGRKKKVNMDDEEEELDQVETEMA